MRLGPAILALAAVFLLGGCSLKKQQTAHAAPPPPKPPAPAKPAEPLSIPQTTVELPPPQPIPPDALPPVEPGGQPAPPPPPSRPAPKPQPNRQPQRGEPAAPVGPAPPPAQPPPDRPPVDELVPAAEAKRLQDEAHGRIQETRQMIARIPARRLNQQKSVYNRIQSFLTQSEDAERRGDMRQASELAGRALVLARELRP